MFISWLDGGYGFGARDHRSKVPFSSHHIQDTYDQHNLTAEADFVHLAKVIRFVSFSLSKLFSTPTSTLYSRNVTLPSPHLRIGELHTDNREQTSGYREGEGQYRSRDWEIHTSVCKIVYKDVLYKLGEYSQYFLITINGK